MLSNKTFCLLKDLSELSMYASQVLIYTQGDAEGLDQRMNSITSATGLMLIQLCNYKINERAE